MSKLAQAKITRKPLTLEQRFEIDVANYTKRSSKLSHLDSAKGWMALATKAPKSSMDWRSDDTPMAMLVAALPGPESWPDLKVLAGRLPRSARNTALQSLIDVFLNDRMGASKRLSSLKGLDESHMIAMNQIRLDLVLVEGDRSKIVEAYKSLAASIVRLDIGLSGSADFKVANLDQVLGKALAEALLKTLFKTYSREIIFEGSKEFRRFAAKIALDNITTLKHPQWHLAIAPEGGPLFEAMHRKFPQVERGINEDMDFAGDTYAAAGGRYAAYLVATGRTSEALAFVKDTDSQTMLMRQVPDDEVAWLQKQGKLDEFISFYEGLIQNGLIQNVTHEYLGLCDAAQKPAHGYEFLDSLPAKIAKEMRYVAERKSQYLISVGKFVEAGELLAAELKADKEDQSSTLASRLVGLGKYLHRQDFIDLGLSSAVKSLKDPDFLDEWVSRELLAQNRGPEAEEMLAHLLQVEMSDGFNSNRPDALECLARLYAQSGRYPDAIKLFEQAPNWDEADAARLGDSYEREQSLAFVLAQSLAGVGRIDEAVKVMQFMLQEDNTADYVYELLLNVAPDRAEATLNRLHATSPMAPRPLIWKAELLRRKRQLPQAEALIRQAIALDPQDSHGYWSDNGRFVAYRILGSIEKEMRKPFEPDLLMVKAWNSTKSVKDPNGYSVARQPLNNRIKMIEHLPFDFNLRFELADDLMKEGRSEEAARMVAEGTSLLSTQLGPASDIQWSFRDAKLLAIAEDVLKRACETDPNRSSNWAALGSLYVSIENSADAERCLMRATKIDPNNLMAWNDLYILGYSGSLSQSTVDPLIKNRVRLEPLNRLWAEYSVRDLASLWKLQRDGLAKSIPISRPLFALPASELYLATAADDGSYSSTVEPWPTSPGYILAQDKTISDLMSFIDSLGGGA